MLDSGLRVVRRSYQGSGVRRRPGELIDVTEVRTGVQLERERFIAPVPQDVVPVVVEDGRTFVSAERARDAGYDVAVVPVPNDDE